MRRSCAKRDMEVLAAINYLLRTYHQGDEENLTLLFNKIYKDYVGFALRTLEYWKWCIRSRPSLNKNGTVTALSSNTQEIVGARARRAFFEVFIDNLILLYALIVFMRGRRYISWERTGHKF